ncbi:cytochrome P450 302a1, mitochondrial-like [Euwallacea fornicatus]|uniref:cytochrome P450 302a1, mitochondrial-like n=1 Tax=Euwallacea fornicatus TaxID=995702 RepID=UPI00338FE794
MKMWSFSARSGTICTKTVKLQRLLLTDDAKACPKTAATEATGVTKTGVLPVGTSTATETPSSQSMVFTNMSKSPKILDIPCSLTQSHNVSSFDTVPGPHSLKFISKFWSYVPFLSAEFTAGSLFQVMNLGMFFGNLLSWGGNAKFFQKFFNVYGPVVRLHGPFGRDVVLLSKPEHACLVLDSKDSQPIRAYLNSLEQYRLQRCRFRQAKLFLKSSPEWGKIYESLDKSLQNSPLQHFKTIDLFCDQFIERIVFIRNLQNEMPKTFKNEVLKWCLECFCCIFISRELGFLHLTGLNSTSDPGRILDEVIRAFETICKCEYGFHIWKVVQTPACRTLVRSCDIIDSILGKYVGEIHSGLIEKKDLKSLVNLSLVESLLLKDDVLVEDAMAVMQDMMLIGTNATAHSTAFLLYHLAKNPRCQKKLFDEIMKDPKKLSSPESLKNMPYLQACMKESLRLNPPIPILNRVLGKDVVVHKYQIPKGTYMLIPVHLACLREEYFEDAKKFNPERWLSQEISPLAHQLQMFISMPFGRSPKSCQSKELIQTQLGLLIVKILKRFIVEYNYGEITSSNALLATPIQPLNFRFLDRV